MSEFFPYLGIAPPLDSARGWRYRRLQQSRFSSTLQSGKWLSGKGAVDLTV